MENGTCLSYKDDKCAVYTHKARIIAVEQTGTIRGENYGIAYLYGIKYSNTYNYYYYGNPHD